MSELSPFLNQLFERYHRREFLGSDPLEFPHRFSDPWDQEAVALVSALLAYGNVKQIRRSVQDLLERIGANPSAFVRALGTAAGQAEGRKRLQGFVHRFNRGEDLLLLLSLLQKSWEKHGSLGAHFL